MIRSYNKANLERNLKNRVLHNEQTEKKQQEKVARVASTYR